MKKSLKDLYSEWLKNNKWYSLNTVDNYTRSINRFDNFIKNLSFDGYWVEECEKIKLYHISLFISDLRDQWLEVRTCNNILSAIRKFLRFCLILWYKVIDYNAIEYWKEYKKKIWYLSEEEQKRLINTARHDKTPELIRMRNLSIIYLFLYTWMRVSELADLKVEQIAEEFQIAWKWWTVRPTYLFNDHIRCLNLYWFLREWKKIYSDYAFCSHSRNYPSRKMSRNSIENIIKNTNTGSPQA